MDYLPRSEFDIWAAFGRGVRYLNYYLVPIAIAVISALVVISGSNLYSSPAPNPVTLQAALAPNPNEQLTPEQALGLAAKAPAVRYFNNKLVEGQIWVLFQTPAAGSGLDVVEFPSRHATYLRCWNDQLTPIGSASESASDQAVFRVRAGYALRLSGIPSSSFILCNTQLLGAARLYAEAWPADNLAVAAQLFHRASGMVDGGLLLLAAFLLVTAAINRQSLYVLLAVWLVVTMRLAETSGGWDRQWLNFGVPLELRVWIRPLTRAIWAVLLVSIFKTLFARELERLGRMRLITFSQALAVGLVVLAVAAPRSVFYPVLWAVGATVFVVLGASIINISYKTRSLAAYLYGVSFAITLVSTLAELFAAAFADAGLENQYAGVVSALASGLLASLAIAEQMRQEHLSRINAQEALQHTFDAVPVGLFTLDLESGEFLSANPAMFTLLAPEVKILGSCWSDHFDGGTWLQLRNLAASGSQSGTDLIMRDARLALDGRHASYAVRASRAGGRIEGFLQDVTAQVQASEHLEFVAKHDSLTRCLNRRGIEAELTEQLALASPTRPLAVAFLDLDRFKLINDTFGRGVGDQVLIHVCSRVQELLSGAMKLGRLGGDEFLLVLPDLKADVATAICSRIVNKLTERPFDINDQAFNVAGSIGLIQFTETANPRDAIATADRACRQAKKTGGTVVSFDRRSPAYDDY